MVETWTYMHIHPYTYIYLCIHVYIYINIYISCQSPIVSDTRRVLGSGKGDCRVKWRRGGGLRGGKRLSNISVDNLLNTSSGMPTNHSVVYGIAPDG
jgi:hypothetical protein